MSFPEFRNRFIVSYATYLGDFLRPDVCVPLIDEMEEEIIDELPYTFAAYENMSTLKKHQYGLDRLYNYVSTRPTFVYQHMADYFSLGDVIPVSIQKELPEGEETIDINIAVCDVPLRTGRFDGAWFTSFPLSLYTKAEDAAWLMNVFHADGSSSSEAFYTSQIQPDLTSCIPGDSISFVATTASIADNIQTHHSNCTVAAIYDATGKKLPAMQKGLNIVLYSDGTRRKILHE